MNSRQLDASVREMGGGTAERQHVCIGLPGSALICPLPCIPTDMTCCPLPAILLPTPPCSPSSSTAKQWTCSSCSGW